jgi:predicted AlkP superfamily pyrophosphatase or phosphodiesterase
MKSKVVLIVFDGCRPDALVLAQTPHVDALWQTGAYTWQAQSIAPSITLPTHMSMFRGISPEKHGVLDNIYQPTAAAFPSIVDIAHEAGLRTAMFYSWEQLRDLSAPGSLTLSYCRDCYTDADADQRVAEQAAIHLADEQPDLAFVYLGSSDLAGHVAGWMSPAYIAAVESMDQALGHLLDALKQAGVYEQYAFLLLADHGGHDQEHGSDSAEDLTIPWIITGPPVKQRHSLQVPVRIVDTAATVAYLLNVPQPEVWEGRPVIDAFRE